MSWVPNPRVRFAGSSFTGAVVDSVTVTRGRDSVYADMRPGYAQVVMRDVDEGLEVEVGRTMTVTVDDSAGQPVTLFTGTVSDWRSEALPTVDDSPLVTYTVRAVGPLARLPRRSVFAAGRSVELDGARVAAALTAGLGATWQETNPFLQWQLAGSPTPTPDYKLPGLSDPSEVDPAATWATYDAVDPSLIDDGVFNVAALPVADAGYGAQSVVNETAFSAEGILFETADGRVGYADADRRALNAGAGYLELPAAVLERDGFSLSSDLSDLVNQVIVEYAGGAVTESDSISIGLYGTQERTLSTVLADLSNAETLAAAYLLRHSLPSRILDQLSMSLLNPDGPTRDGLLAVNVNDAIAVTGIPSKAGLAQFQGFVEGLTFVASQFDVRLRLDVSELFFSVGDPRWSQIAGTLEWLDVGASTTWEDSRSLV